MWEEHPATMRVSLARHDALMREAIVAANGYVFKTVGDAFCAAFSTAGNGVQAALAAQLAIRNEAWPDETPIRVRMALHTGAVESRDDDYFGPPLNRVARLLATAHGEQSILSQTTFDLVRDSLPPEVSLHELGTHLLKDLARPEQVFQILHPGLRDEFPGLRSLSNQPNNLPLQLTSFVGREAEIESVKALFESHRLVTLSGAGGSGKTRLSLQIAAELLETFPDGVWLVELAAVLGSDQIARAVADVLSIQERKDQSLSSTIAEQIRNKRILIILDNCEHLIESSARLADQLLKSCPSLKIIATSREPLGIRGEMIFKLPPLSIPDMGVRQTPESLSQFAAVRLFIDRAIQASPNFTVTNENAPSVASVCARLDGIPLAIELAAARIRSLSIEQIESRLGQRFSLLTGGSRVALPRQQTLRALIDWSYDLLQPTEKTVLQRLSVFLGGSDLEAAEDVCSDDEVQGWLVSENLLALVDKSLVVIQEHESHHRYHLLESIREYAKERLNESGEAKRYEDRHFDYFLRLTRTAVPHLRGAQQRAWLVRLDQDWDNIHAALRYGINREAGLEMAGNLSWYWFFRGYFARGRLELSAALEKNPSAALATRLDALRGLGVLAYRQLDYQIALTHYHECIEMSRELGDQKSLATMLTYVGNVYGSQSRYDTAEGYWEQALEIWRAIDSPGDMTVLSGMAAVMDNLGNVAGSRGQNEEARTYYHKCYELRVKVGNPGLAAYSLLNLGTLEFTLGNCEASLKHYQEGLEISYDLKDTYGIGYFLFYLAGLAPPDLAARLLGRFDQICDDIEITLNEEESAAYAVLEEKLTVIMTRASYEMGRIEGRSMNLDRAVREALAIELE